MQLQNAERKRVKLRLNIASPSGFGKTYGALLIAYGITGNWPKIAVIDTENDSASLYSHLGEYKTLSLKPPYTPDRYIEAIKICEDAGIEVIIIDSITHVWKGQGGLLSFPFAGYTFAIDFPITSKLRHFTKKLDDMVLAMGGRIYMGKDAYLDEPTFKAMYPQHKEWLEIKKKYDPTNVFSSDLSRRIGLDI